MASKRIFTLVFLKRNDEILLGMKTRGLGVGKWNGFGGKVEINESIFDGAKRELKEECNLIADNLKHIGVVRYEEENNQEIAIVHIFTSNTYTGDIKPSEEMNPVKWYNFSTIPYEKMWPDSKFWYKFMLQEKFFSVYVKYNLEGKIQEKLIKECNCLENALQLAY